MDEGMLDGVACMTKFVNLVASEPEISKVNEIGKYIVKLLYLELDKTFFKTLRYLSFRDIGAEINKK